MRIVLAVLVLSGCQHLGQPSPLEQLCDDWRVIRPNNMADAKRIPRYMAKQIVDSNRNREIRGCAKFGNRPAMSETDIKRDTLDEWARKAHRSKR